MRGCPSPSNDGCRPRCLTRRVRSVHASADAKVMLSICIHCCRPEKWQMLCAVGQYTEGPISTHATNAATRHHAHYTSFGLNPLSGTCLSASASCRSTAGGAHREGTPQHRQAALLPCAMDQRRSPRFAALAQCQSQLPGPVHPIVSRQPKPQPCDRHMGCLSNTQLYHNTLRNPSGGGRGGRAASLNDYSNATLSQQAANPITWGRGGRAASGSRSRRTCCQRGCRARRRPGWPARCARAASRTTRRSRASAPGRPADAYSAAPRPTPCPAGLLGFSAQAGLHSAPQRPAVRQQETLPRRPAAQWWSISGLSVKCTNRFGFPVSSSSALRAWKRHTCNQTG